MIDRVHSASPYESRYGFCRALRVGDRIIVAGTAPIEADGTSVAEEAYAQTQRCIAIMLEPLGQLGGAPADVVQTRMFITDPLDADDIGRAHGEARARRGVRRLSTRRDDGRGRRPARPPLACRDGAGGNLRTMSDSPRV